MSIDMNACHIFVVLTDDAEDIAGVYATVPALGNMFSVAMLAGGSVEVSYPATDDSSGGQVSRRVLHSRSGAVVLTV